MIDNALDYEGLKHYNEKAKSYIDNKITQFQDNANKTFRTATSYADGTTTSINDLTQDGIYRIYIQKDSADHNYLGFYGQIIVETFMQANITYQRINKLSSGETYLRYTANQNTTPLSYDTTLIKIANASDVEKKVDKVDGKGLSTNDYTTDEKNKLNGIANGAEVNQNAFSNVKVGSTTISADSKTDTLILEGNNITITPDETNDKVVFDITKENVISALGYTPSEGASATNKRYALVGQNSSTTTNPWYKFASIDISTNRQDYDITFLVRRTFGNNYIDDMGILRAHIRADKDINCEMAVLEWLVVSPSINTSDFVISYVKHTNLQAELWVKCDLAYSMWNFDVLSEGNRLSNAEYWTLYTTMTAGSEAEIPSDYTQVESTILELGQNAISSSTIYLETKSSSSAINYPIPFAESNNNGNQKLSMNNGFLYKTINGTINTGGKSAIILGNSTPEGEVDNMSGLMFIYGDKNFYTQLSPLSQTKNRTINLPDASGTIALENGSIAHAVNADNSTKIKANAFTTTTLSNYSIPYFEGGTTGDKTLLMNNGFTYRTVAGTTSTTGEGTLVLGNPTPKGVNDNITGSIIAYGENSYHTQLLFGTQTQNRSITFPDASGTVGLMSNIPWTRNSGTYINQRAVGVHGFITDSGTKVYLYFPMILDRSVTFTSSINITNMLCDIRTVEGTFLGGTQGVNLASSISETFIYTYQGLLRVVLEKPDGWGILNNTPLCGDCTLDYTIG